jgi:hypothetical protein
LVKRAPLCSECLVKCSLMRYSQEKEPEKKTTPRPSTLHPQYGGPGSFKPSNPGDVPASLRTGHGSAGSSPSGGKQVPLQHERHTSSPGSGNLPDSLRPSGSLAKLDLYVPPYETKTLDTLSASHAARPGNVSEFGVNGAVRRRDSFPASFSVDLFQICPLIITRFFAVFPRGHLAATRRVRFRGTTISLLADFVGR